MCTLFLLPRGRRILSAPVALTKLLSFSSTNLQEDKKESETFVLVPCWKTDRQRNTTQHNTRNPNSTQIFTHKKNTGLGPQLCSCRRGSGWRLAQPIQKQKRLCPSPLLVFYPVHDIKKKGKKQNDTALPLKRSNKIKKTNKKNKKKQCGGVRWGFWTKR